MELKKLDIQDTDAIKKLIVDIFPVNPGTISGKMRNYSSMYWR